MRDEEPTLGSRTGMRVPSTIHNRSAASVVPGTARARWSAPQSPVATAVKDRLQQPLELLQPQPRERPRSHAFSPQHLSHTPEMPSSQSCATLFGAVLAAAGQGWCPDRGLRDRNRHSLDRPQSSDGHRFPRRSGDTLSAVVSLSLALAPRARMRSASPLLNPSLLA